MELVEQVFAHAGALTQQERRAAVLQVQDVLLSLPSVLEDCTVRHLFAPGCYAREMTIPEGTVIVGKIHRHAHLNIISSGHVRVVTEFGSEEIVAPHTFVSVPGTKRVVYALENTIWTTIHPTDKTDLAEIERDVIAPGYEDIEIRGECSREDIL